MAYHACRPAYHAATVRFPRSFLPLYETRTPMPSTCPSLAAFPAYRHPTFWQNRQGMWAGSGGMKTKDGAGSSMIGKDSGTCGAMDAHGHTVQSRLRISTILRIVQM